MESNVTVERVDQMSTATPEQVLEAIVDGINTGNLADGTWRFVIDNPWGVG
jgi:hypothetical protein